MPGSTIQLNGRPHELGSAQTVAELLESLGLASKPVVVELDGLALTPAEHPSTAISPGASLEIITLAAGG